MRGAYCEGWGEWAHHREAGVCGLAAYVADVDLLDYRRGFPVRPGPVERDAAYVAAGAARIEMHQFVAAHEAGAKRMRFALRRREQFLRVGFLAPVANRDAKI